MVMWSRRPPQVLKARGSNAVSRVSDLKVTVLVAALAEASRYGVSATSQNDNVAPENAHMRSVAAPSRGRFHKVALKHRHEITVPVD